MEANNNKSVRETLIEISKIEDDWESYANTKAGALDRIYELAKAALAAPPKNCEVGTADEQTARFRKFCSAHKYLSSDFSYICKGFWKGRCPFSKSHTKSQCEFAWSQMPYEESGEK